MSENPLPLEYLVTSSQSAVESFELSRLNRVSNLRKEIRQIVDEWIAAEAEARIARWILDCRRARTDDAAPLRSSATDALPATPPSAAAEHKRCDPIPMEEMPPGAPYEAALPLLNALAHTGKGKLGAHLSEIPKAVTSHTAKLVLQLLEHVTRRGEALSAPIRIGRPRSRRSAVRASHSGTESPVACTTGDRRNLEEPRIPPQSLATANPARSQSPEAQGIRPASPMRSPVLGAAQCNRRKAS
jgi:hypothetical protein